MEQSSLTHLTRWNRFWLVLVCLYVVISGANSMIQRAVANAMRLQISWGASDNNSQGLILSSAGGGPFIVTHLVSQGNQGGIDTATSAIAELPHPLFVRGPKAQTYVSVRELAKMKWIEADGTKVAAPKPGEPVLAIYYETSKVSTSR